MKYLSPQRPNGGVFDVVSFKADPSGTSDSTAAFQAAWDAASAFGTANGGQGSMLIPPGKYKLQGRVTMESNVDVSAYGAYIFGGTDYTYPNTGTGGNLMFMSPTGSEDGYTGGSSNVTVRGGIWDAKGQNAPTGGVRDIFCPSNGVNWQFIDCVMRNVPSWHALDLNSLSGVTVQNCRFEGFVDKSSLGNSYFREAIQLDTGVDGTPCENVVVTGCYMGPSPDGSGLGGFGKLVGSHNPTVANTGPHLGVTVTGCIAEDAQYDAIGFYYTSQLTVTGNTIRGAAKSGIRIEGSGSSRVAVTGNTVANCGEHGIFLGDSVNGKLTGNNIDFVTLSGIQIDACTRAMVDGNSIYDAGQRGIWIAAGTTKSAITNNLIVGAGRGTNNTYGGIEVSAYQNNDNLIRGNRIGKNGSSGSNFAIRPIHFASSNTSTNIQIGNNSYDGFTEKGVMVHEVSGVGTIGNTGAWGNLSDGAGPLVQMVTGSHVRIVIKAVVQNTATNSAVGAISVEVSGAASRSVDYDAQIDGIDANQKVSVVATLDLDGLTPGLNTFTMKYRSFSNTMSCDYRRIIVESIAV